MDIKEVFKILEIDDKINYEKMSTEEYFHNNKFSIDAFNKKYAMYEGETYYQAMKRVCDYIASAEKTEEQKKYWSKRWLYEILNDYWSPAGSIIQGAASDNKISMMNCTTIGLPEDSLEALIRYTAYNITRTASYRQGLGTNYNNIRPRNSKVNNSSKTSDGVISWMSLNDSLSYHIGQHGRIPAQLMSLSCFDGNTAIKTSFGWLTIKNIVDNFSYYVKENLRIWTEDGLKNISGYNTKDEQDIYEIVTECGKKIKVTSDHEFMMKNLKTKEEYLKKISDYNSDIEELVIIEFKN